MTKKKTRQIMLYFLESAGESFNVFQTPMDTRHKFWTAHPTAKEISKKEYEELFRQSKPAAGKPAN